MSTPPTGSGSEVFVQTLHTNPDALSDRDLSAVDAAIGELIGLSHRLSDDPLGLGRLAAVEADLLGRLALDNRRLRAAIRALAGDDLTATQRAALAYGVLGDTDFGVVGAQEVQPR
jgi:hypothetical protein